MKNISVKLLLLIIIILGFSIRVMSIDWDSGHKFHPDERAIIMNVVDLRYPNSFTEFITKESTLNTNFFAYGNFPIYLLKVTGDIASHLDPSLSQYGGIHIVGRLINIFVSTLTVFLIFIFSKYLFNTRTALLSAFFYSIAVFPIQNSVFFTVDTILTFLVLLTLYLVTQYIKNPRFINAVFIGCIFGLTLATKISAAPLLLVILMGFIISFLVTKNEKSLNSILNTTVHVFTFSLLTLLLFITTQPYVLIDFSNFFQQVIAQTRMGSNPFVFPYTLQYVGKIPVLYEIKNIALWGLGLPLSIIAFTGAIYLSLRIINYKKEYIYLPVVVFFWLFLILNSSYAVGWMRYLLPIYPLLTIFAGYFVVQFYDFVSSNKIFSKNYLKYFFIFLLLFSSFIWTLSFFNSVYLNPHTKIKATEWILENIPNNSTIATEHWDDVLPVYGGENYAFISLPLYDPDTQEKWDNINNDLQRTDYIIIASNRLHTPLSKLTECEKLPEGKCYVKTAQYYEKLLAGELGFEKVAEFSSYPTIPFLNIEINDQSADESFTVYDHPTVIIFKNYEKK